MFKQKKNPIQTPKINNNKYLWPNKNVLLIFYAVLFSTTECGYCNFPPKAAAQDQPPCYYVEIKLTWIRKPGFQRPLQMRHPEPPI